MINGLKKVPYEERLRLMDLPTLSYRRLHEDAIEAYKFVHGKYSVDWLSLLPLADETSTVVTSRAVNGYPGVRVPVEQRVPGQ